MTQSCFYDRYSKCEILQFWLEAYVVFSKYCQFQMAEAGVKLYYDLLCAVIMVYLLKHRKDNAIILFCDDSLSTLKFVTMHK